MPDVAGRWLCSLLHTLGGIFGWEISYLGVAGLDTPIWDVLAPQGEQERVLNCLTMRARSKAGHESGSLTGTHEYTRGNTCG